MGAELSEADERSGHKGGFTLAKPYNAIPHFLDLTHVTFVTPSVLPITKITPDFTEARRSRSIHNIR